jgi:hypothetical protein
MIKLIKLTIAVTFLIHVGCCFSAIKCNDGDLIKICEVDDNEKIISITPCDTIKCMNNYGKLFDNTVWVGKGCHISIETKQIGGE